MILTLHFMEKEGNVKEKNNFLGILIMSKPGKSLKELCKRLKVRLTVKRGKKRVYKSIKVLKAQCANKKKVKKKNKKVKRRRKFGDWGIKYKEDQKGNKIFTNVEPLLLCWSLSKKNKEKTQQEKEIRNSWLSMLEYPDYYLDKYSHNPLTSWIFTNDKEPNCFDPDAEFKDAKFIYPSFIVYE